MDMISERISKVTDLSNYTDLTPEHLRKLFNDIGASPEKLRTILNLWFVPDFKPTFVDAQRHALGGIQDNVQLLEAPNAEGAPRPERLIDLETGNIVERRYTSALDSYCMLSHRWKGDEITLANIKRARQKHLERTKEALGCSTTQVGAEQHDPSAARDGDIYLVLKQSKVDILEQEQVIISLSGEDIDVGALLSLRIKANIARDNLNRAQQDWDAKKAVYERSRIEKKTLDQIMNRINDNIDDKMKRAAIDPRLHVPQPSSSSSFSSSGGADVMPARRPSTSDHKNAATATVVQDAGKEHAAAQKKLAAARKYQVETERDAKRFNDNIRLGDAVDEMMKRLQLWRSAIKLQCSIEEAKRIFNTKIFPKGGARYIWSDTCCIDKQNYGELSTSLSLMGDWYANGEFCLVHLDTDSNAADAVLDWHRFRREVKGESDAPGAHENVGIPSFKAISGSGPEWSNRAWTLQELVMSKMAFFANSEWKPLGRPVESLGYTYPLIPFIDIYTRGDVSSNNIYSEVFNDVEYRRTILRDIRDAAAEDSLLNMDEVEIVDDGKGEEAAAEQVREAALIISILRSLGLRLPADLTTETAISEMARSVCLAAWSLTRDEARDETRDETRDEARYDEEDSEDTIGKAVGERNSKMLFELINEKNLVPAASETKSRSQEEAAQETINFLLACLVAETKSLIVSDRKTIAEFGQVNQLETWKQGTDRSGFPAQQVLHLSCRRRATVPVDHVYSLMGILGVRFPVFHAEGYPKALARLLDEVIITHNDVSVFNWTGPEMGSPVRGRSMYPASHRAYGSDEDRGRRYNLIISAEAERKRKEVMVTYHGIVHMLQDAMDCIKTKGRKGIPLEWVRLISAFVRHASFDALGPELKNMGKILVYVKECCDHQPVAPPSPPPAGELPSRSSTNSSLASADDKSGWSFGMKPSLPGVSSIKKRSSRFGMPSFGRHHSEPVMDKAVDQEPVSDEQAKPAIPEGPEWMSLDGQVRTYLESLKPSDQSHDAQQRPPLPDRIQKLDFKAPEPEGLTANTEDDDATDTPAENHICPNPIIVNSSGIDGIFDIQRVIVTMVDREKLSRQVARASSPKQKISGWCTISTGFASVAVGFACEQHILRKQLDVEKAIEDKLIKEERARKLHGSLEILRTTHKTKRDEKEESCGSAAAAQESGLNDGEADKLNEREKVMTTKEEEGGGKPTKEEQTIVRIINFIQEPQLQLVAGEWVLARFSGVRGAKWFLCRFELGSTHSFYGHRIATTDIDFSNSSVEPGLVNSWQTYMNRKKRKMCGILNKYIKSFQNAVESDEKYRLSTAIVNQNLEKVLRIGGSMSPSALMFASSESTTKEVRGPAGGGNNDDNNYDSDDDDEDSKLNLNFLSDVLDQSKEALSALGEYTYLAAYEKICGLHARHLEKHLSTSVLKRTPKSLQTAVESVDSNKGFLPAMFHSSQRVHMF